MTPLAALSLLRNHPTAFLKANVLRCAGHPFVNGLCSYTIQNSGGVQNEFEVMPGTDIPHAYDYVPNSKGFMAWSVVMQKSSDVAPGALQGLVLPPGGHSDFMITGILNGCTFCILNDPNRVEVAHIKPSGITAEFLQVSLHQNGRFASAPHVGITTFGQKRDYAGNEDATVVGVRKNGRWKIYAQIHTRTQWDNLRVDTIFAA